MIRLKTRIVGHDDKSQFIQVIKYKTKHTTTAEHICAINTLITAILDNDKNMTINKLTTLIKDNYKKSMEDK